MKKKKSVYMSLRAGADTEEARLLNYLRDDPMINRREAVFRALMAYYLPWVHEDEFTDVQLQALAQSAVEDLEFRIYQIRKRFLANQGGTPQLAAAPQPTIAASLPPAESLSGGPMPPVPPPALTQSMPPPSAVVSSVQEMLKDTEIDPSVLDDF
ncbi:MAG: hypothetical protein AAGG51_10380 [Cyanobacteria bacterium P01_G01_bin.54]